MVTVTPIDPCGNPIPQQTMQQVQPQFTPEQQAYAQQVYEYVNSPQYQADLQYQAQANGVSKKAVEDKFFQKIWENIKSIGKKVLGTVGDILHIGVGVVQNTFSTIIDLLKAVLSGVVNTVCGVANGAVSIVTLNQTCRG